MTFDIRQLNAFLAVVQHGSLGRAAQTLNVTQPALSRTIRRLEDQIGAPLFERYSTGMMLTSFGQALLPHATLLQREAEQATEELNALRGLARGTIRVGAVASAVSLVLPIAIGRVLAQWPNLQVHVVEGVGDLLTDALLTHDIDLAIGVSMPGTTEISVVPDCEWHDTSQIIAAASHPLRKRARLKLEDTVDHKWVLPPRGTAPFEELTRLFASRGLPLPDVVVETRSIIAIKSMVAHAGFLSWMPQPMYEAERAAGMADTLHIPGVGLQRRLMVFRRSKGILPQPAVKLLDELRLIAGKGPL
ncbi:LysR family transcriptional regulator [Pigmentiphaga sp. NML080357]|uniref:LysR family transcriptional regulator n=1 Tax=Pigmentiphaga sp. NML080357 TaxID=2008675 RepID=UPI000B4097C8|nr:LysR family transcriptional regulator [Pigmentiphaga sp. NML080357]OVZ57248.1 LysR family transcriptional regulator [Pigmentiphaga sp. NML080357]